MNTKMMTATRLLNAAILAPLMLQVMLLATPSFAEDGVIKQDDQRISQDRHDLKQTNQDLKQTNEKIVADKASGNVAQLEKDRKAKQELRRTKRQEKQRLQQDKKEKTHDVKNP